MDLYGVVFFKVMYACRPVTNCLFAGTCYLLGYISRVFAYNKENFHGTELELK